MTAPMVIVLIGAEGGSIALIGERAANGNWRYQRALVDQTLTFLSADEAGPEIRDASGWVKTWAEALNLLDQYPWPSLSVLEVHPTFAPRILEAVIERTGEKAHPRQMQNLRRWREYCVVT
jgi:hypothetical protein